MSTRIRPAILVAAQEAGGFSGIAPASGPGNFKLNVRVGIRNADETQKPRAGSVSLGGMRTTETVDLNGPDPRQAGWFATSQPGRTSKSFFPVPKFQSYAPPLREVENGYVKINLSSRARRGRDRDPPCGAFCGATVS